MSEDQRKSPRRELKLQAMLMVEGASKPRKVKTLDIGQFGMTLVGIATPLEAGQEVRVSFDMFFAGKLHQVEVNSRVSHCMNTPTDGYRAGLQFLTVEAETADMLAKYVGA
jgi:hypothetical protein